MVGKKRPRVIIMPGDLGDSKTRREYRKPSPVKIYYLENDKMDNEYNSTTNNNKNIIPLEDFLAITEPKEAQLKLKEIAEEYSDTQIADMWDMSFSKLKTLRTNLGVIKDRKGNVVELLDEIKWNSKDNETLLSVIRVERDKNIEKNVFPNEKNEQILVEKREEREEFDIKQEKYDIKQEEFDIKLDETSLKKENIEPKLDELENYQGFVISLNSEFDAIELIGRLESLCKNIESTPYSRYKIELKLVEVNIKTIKGDD